MLWHIALYTVGTGLALRSLISLMANHKCSYERQLKRLATQKDKANHPESRDSDQEQEAATVATKPTAA